MPDEMRPLYLISGTDGSKIEATRSRLRARAEREGGDGALEVFEPGEGRGAPDHEALLAAIPAMSLMGTRRYLLADGIEKWRDKQLGAVADAEAESTPLDPGPIDVLKVAHHGSDDAGLGPLLDRIRPRLAVISVGADNSYGHPTPGTLATLAAHGVPTLRTDLDGTVEIEVTRRGFSVDSK